MSELTTRFIDDTYAEYYNTGKHELAQIYLKQDVDKLIADLEESHKKEVEQLLIEIVELKKERRWRSVSKELPPDGVAVAVCFHTEEGKLVTSVDCLFDEEWQMMDDCEGYWMPLPKAPKDAK